MNYANNIRVLFQDSLLNIAVLKFLLSLMVVIVLIMLRRLFIKLIDRLIVLLADKSKSLFIKRIILDLGMPVRLIFIIIAISIWLKVLNPPQDIKDFIVHIIRSMIAFSIFWTIYRASDPIITFIESMLKRTEKQLDNILLLFLRNSLKTVIFTLGVSVILQEWGYNMAGLLAGLGLGGLAFALAAKDTASNLFGSIMIMIDKPFAIGDWIVTPHAEGIVEDIGFRSTRIRTFAQALVTVPNSLMSSEPITNISRMGKRRITFNLGLTYNTTEEELKEFIKRLRELLNNHPQIHQDTIIVCFDKFGDSALEVFIYFFTLPTAWQQHLEVQEDVNFKIMKLLEDMGLTIAFPTQSIYVEKNK